VAPGPPSNDTDVNRSEGRVERASLINKMIGHYHSIRPPLGNFLNGARRKSVPSQEALYIRARLVVEEIVMTSQIGIIQTDPSTAGVRAWGLIRILAEAIFKVPILPSDPAAPGPRSAQAQPHS
jgi:hypothetical protein